MKTKKIQDLKDYCFKCKNDVLSRYNNGEITLDEARKICAYCKYGKNGIYKFDIAFTAQSLSNQSLNKRFVGTGKKATYFKRYGEAIKNLKNEGKSNRQIAAIIGISQDTVRKILKQLENTEPAQN